VNNMKPYRRILTLIDFDPQSEGVAQRALLLARLNRAQLAFVHLVEPDAALDGGYPATSPKASADALEAGALRRLNFMAAQLGAGEAECLTGFGPRTQVFQRILKDWQPDLVVAARPLPAKAGAVDCLVAAQSGQAGGGRLKRLGDWLVSAFSPALM
jgi:nucleotide-binding universal stress UspA family protein